jgi:hypothetical protein
MARSQKGIGFMIPRHDQTSLISFRHIFQELTETLTTSDIPYHRNVRTTPSGPLSCRPTNRVGCACEVKPAKDIGLQVVVPYTGRKWVENLCVRFFQLHPGTTPPFLNDPRDWITLKEFRIVIDANMVFRSNISSTTPFPIEPN